MPHALVPPGVAAGRPRDIDKQARLTVLLQTAESLFIEKGYAQVSLQAIARQAHVAVRTIYVKFGGKAGLLSAVIAAGRSRDFDAISALETDRRPLGELLNDIALRVLALMSLPSFIALQRMAVAEAVTTPELAQAFYRAGPQQARDLLTRFFSRPDIAAQLDSDLPPATLSLHLLNCLLGDQASRTLFGTPPPPGHTALHAQVALSLRLFLQGVRRQRCAASLGA